jgi:hypothetical protein
MCMYSIIRLTSFLFIWKILRIHANYRALIVFEKEINSVVGNNLQQYNTEEWSYYD